MSAQDSTTAHQLSQVSEKSKGKQADQGEAGDMSMDDDSAEEDSGVEEVCQILKAVPVHYKQYTNEIRLQKVEPDICTISGTLLIFDRSRRGRHVRD